MNEPALRTGSYYGDCRDWLRIDLDRKMTVYRGKKDQYAPDLTRIGVLCQHYGFTEAMIKKAAEIGLIKPGRKHREKDKHMNLYDGNEVALRAAEIEKLRGQV